MALESEIGWIARAPVFCPAPRSAYPKQSKWGHYIHLFHTSGLAESDRKCQSQGSSNEYIMFAMVLFRHLVVGHHQKFLLHWLDFLLHSLDFLLHSLDQRIREGNLSRVTLCQRRMEISPKSLFPCAAWTGSLVGSVQRWIQSTSSQHNSGHPKQAMAKIVSHHLGNFQTNGESWNVIGNQLLRLWLQEHYRLGTQ